MSVQPTSLKVYIEKVLPHIARVGLAKNAKPRENLKNEMFL